MALPHNVHRVFVDLTAVYRDKPIEFPHLKAITLAQWAIESAWGRTQLAHKFFNFAGMKWIPAMAPFGTPVMYAAHDGRTQYVHFNNLESFIDAYWARLDMVAHYGDWRVWGNRKPADFMKWITPAWLTGRQAGEPLNASERAYLRDTLKITENRTAELFT